MCGSRSIDARVAPHPLAATAKQQDCGEPDRSAQTHIHKHTPRISPMRAINIEDLRRAAKKRLPRVVFDYIDGGADAEWTMRENSRVFDDVLLRPRSAVATPDVDLRT